VLSHLIQQPPGWFWSSRPVWLYRWSQGLPVFCGIAAVPVLLTKPGRSTRTAGSVDPVRDHA
jgi:hypothetical protein